MAPGRCAGRQHWEVIECISSDSTGEGRARRVAELHPGAGCGSSLVQPPAAGGQAERVPSHPSTPEHTAMLHSLSPGHAILPERLAQGTVSMLAWQQLPVPSCFPPCTPCRALSWWSCSAEGGSRGVLGHQADPVLLRVGGSPGWMGSLLLSPSSSALLAQQHHCRALISLWAPHVPLFL